MKPWENNIRRVDPYIPGEQPNKAGMVKINTNENPYPPAPGVIQILNNMNPDTLRRYPDPTIGLLVRELSEFYRLKEEQVFVGVGSDDVLAMAFMTFFNSTTPVLFPDITYSFYPVWCELFSIPYETPALTEDLRINKTDYYRENGGVIIANPNAPTGIYEDLGFIEDIIENNQSSVVIVDEAYVDFAGRSAIELIDKYENLLVVQTFSKARSMAGMRIGYAMGSTKLIKALNDVKYSFNSYTMNQTAIMAGIEAVRDVEYFRDKTNKIINTREEATAKFTSLGFAFPTSGANFIFVSHTRIPAIEIYRYLRANNIFVRHFNMPRIDNYLRISIGSEEDMNRLFASLHKFVEEYQGS